jgi:hypothetical protein
MLQATSIGYNDPEFVDRSVDVNNRVAPLQNTELYVQTSLATNSKFAFPNNVSFPTQNESSTIIDDWIALQPNYYTYIGPFSSSTNQTQQDPTAGKLLYSMPISVQYVVPDNQSQPYFNYAIEKDHLPLQCHWSYNVTAPIGMSMRVSDWDDYPLYPPIDNASIYVNTNSTKSHRRRLLDHTKVLSTPFQGKVPNIVQIATASSAALRFVATSVPSILAQWVSVRQYSSNNETFCSKLLNRLLLNLFSRTVTLRRDFALCSQWPNQLCGPTDTYFFDGGSTDSPGMF